MKSLSSISTIAISTMVFSVVLTGNALAADEPQWAVGAKVLSADKTRCQPLQADCDGLHHGIGVFAEYDSRQLWSVETSYFQLWDVIQPEPLSARSHLRAIDVSAKIHWRLGSEASLYAKAGAMRWFAPSLVNTAIDDNQYNKRGWAPVLGAGMAFYFADNLSARLEYQWSPNLKLSSNTEFDLHLLSAGLSYRFGATPPSRSNSAAPQPGGQKPVALHVTTPVQTQVAAATEAAQTAPANLIALSIQFATNAATALTPAEPVLADIIRQLQQQPGARLRITGHADATGPAAHNMALSAQRAKSIADVLLRAGIAPQQLDISWAGDTLPVANNKTAAGRQLNRRVDIYLKQP
ncbi:OmpA family protein [Rheinheimera sp. NSM]|uniref:OmpA family protein n=1 Tax=Rheinheimera sp. NSM TaxID=3457884 RepID=UPI004035FE33